MDVASKRILYHRRRGLLGLSRVRAAGCARRNSGVRPAAPQLRGRDGDVRWVSRQCSLASAYVLPVNLYGPWDNFDLEMSHVIPALTRNCLEVMDLCDDHIVCWGTGSASREFLYVDDCAKGLARASEVLDEPVPVNLGTGNEITIRGLVTRIAHLCGYQGETRWDSSWPDGKPRRCRATEHAEKLLAGKAKFGFDHGLCRTIVWYRVHRCSEGAAS